MTSTLKYKTSPYNHWEFVDSQNFNIVKICPDRGGLITEWICNGQEILYFDLNRFLDKGKSIRGGIPFLFPICGDLPDNKISFGDLDYEMPQHGFLRNEQCIIELLSNKNGFRLHFSDNEKTKLLYPFSFSIDIEVEVRKNSLGFNIEISNFSLESMPFTFGLHPYFKLEDLRKVDLQGLSLECEDQKTSLKSRTIDQLNNLSHGIDFLTKTSKNVALVDLNTSKRVEVRSNPPMDLTVVWSDPPRNMICVEPWTSPRRSLLTGERKLVIHSGDVYPLSCEFVVI